MLLVPIAFMVISFRLLGLLPLVPTNAAEEGRKRSGDREDGDGLCEAAGE
jgi:hypothetical protein